MLIRRCFWILLLSILVLMTAQTIGAGGQAAGDERPRALAIGAGQDTFSQFCAPCHGMDAQGHGPVAAVLTAVPADLTQVKRRNGGTFPLDRLEAMLRMAQRIETAAHGSGQMPIWGQVFQQIDTTPTLARARVANLLAYLESIQE